jgi:hypothetical protein
MGPSRENWISLVGGIVAVAIIGAFGVPNFVGFQKFDELNGNAAEFAALSVLFVVLNGIIFWRHLRPLFLLFNTAKPTYFRWLLVLVAAFPLAWGGTLLLRGEIVMALLTPARIDYRLTWKCIYVGEAALTMVLLVSSLWKADEPPGLPGFRRAWHTTTSILRAAMAGTLSDDDLSRLNSTLQTLGEGAKLAGVVSPQDVRLIQRWSEEAVKLSGWLKGMTSIDVLRNLDQIKDSVTLLLSTN